MRQAGGGEEEDIDSDSEAREGGGADSRGDESGVSSPEDGSGQDGQGGLVGLGAFGGQGGRGGGGEQEETFATDEFGLPMIGDQSAWASEHISSTINEFVIKWVGPHEIWRPTGDALYQPVPNTKKFSSIMVLDWTVSPGVTTESARRSTADWTSVLSSGVIGCRRDSCACLLCLQAHTRGVPPLSSNLAVVGCQSSQKFTEAVVSRITVSGVAAVRQQERRIGNQHADAARPLMLATVQPGDNYDDRYQVVLLTDAGHPRDHPHFGRPIQEKFASRGSLNVGDDTLVFSSGKC